MSVAMDSDVDMTVNVTMHVAVSMSVPIIVLMRRLAAGDSDSAGEDSADDIDG